MGKYTAEYKRIIEDDTTKPSRPTGNYAGLFWAVTRPGGIGFGGRLIFKRGGTEK